jgi:hypothetical protein
MSRFELNPSALYRDLDPEALTIEPVLVALLFAQHRVVSLPQVLVGPAPSMVNAHRAVGRDRAIQKTKLVGRMLISPQIPAEYLVPVPVVSDVTFHAWHVEFFRNRLEHGHPPQKNLVP